MGVLGTNLVLRKSNKQVLLTTEPAPLSLFFFLIVGDDIGTMVQEERWEMDSFVILSCILFAIVVLCICILFCLRDKVLHEVRAVFRFGAKLKMALN